MVRVPTPLAVGMVNALLLPGRPTTVVDPGPDTAAARDALQRGCAEARVALADIEHVVVTHAHVDHHGLAAWLHEQSGATVIGHALAAPRLTDPASAAERRLALLQRVADAAGVPGDVSRAAARLEEARSALGPPVPADAVRVVRDGARLLAGGAEWTVLHCPGHARDHVCLFHAPSGSAISGDLLLRHLPTPAMLEERRPDGSRPATLADLVASWRRLGRLPIVIAWPGHGRPIRAHRILVARRLAKVRQNLREARAALRAGASTLVEVAGALGLDLEADGLAAGLGDVVALTDWLVKRRLAERRMVDGLLRLGPTGH